MTQLVIRFSPRQQDNRYPLFIRLADRGSEGDEKPAGAFQPPFSGDLTAELAETEAAVLEHWAGAAPGERTVLWGILGKLAKRLMAMGAAVSEALFTANPPLARALAGTPVDVPLVLQFEPDERELLRLPWEYLTDPDGRRLAAVRPLARCLGLPSPPRGEGPGERGGEGPLRLLACIAEPLDQGPLNGQTVREWLMAATGPLREAGWLELRFLPLPATPNRLASALTDWRPDVVHLACHGLPGILALEGEHGGTQQVTAEQIRHGFATWPPRLVVLGACLSAAVLKGDPLGGTAAAFLDASVPAVVAMQFAAQVEAANRFVGDLYAALAGGERQPLDAAVRDARANRFFASDFIDAYQWGVPVLYLQSREADLFAGVVPGDPQPDEAVPGLPQSSPSNVPPRVKPFLGRGPEMARVNARVTRDRLVALHGEGGIGKTALARELAEWHAKRGTYPGGVVWVDLQTPRTVEAIVEEIGVALAGEGFRRMSGDRAAWLREYLKQHSALLVLDNFETVGRDPEVLRFVQSVPTPSAVLLTSREELGGLTRQGLRELRRRPGHALFVEWAVRSGWDGAGDGAMLREICGVLDYMPLAIELVAPQAAELPLPVLLRRVQASVAAVAADWPGLPPRHRSVEATLRLSYQGVSEEAQRLFVRLAVFPGGAYPYELQGPDGQVTDAIRAVCDLADWEPAAVELVRKGLLRLEGQRYRMHGLVRQYGLERLEEARERAEVERRAVEFFLALAQQARSMMGTDQSRAGLAMVGAERANLLWGQQWYGGREEWDQVMAYGDALAYTLNVGGYWADSVTTLTQASEAARRKGDQKGEARFIHNAGIMVEQMGDYVTARRFYQQSLEIKQALGDPAGISMSYHQLGNVAYLQGDYVTARRFYQQSLEIDQALGNRAGVAMSYHQLGILAQAQGDYAAARRFYQQSLDIAQALEDRATVAGSLRQLGILAQDQGDYVTARDFYQQSLEIDQALGNRAGVGKSLHQLGRLAQYQGDYAAARSFYQQSLEIGQALGNRAGVALATFNLGNIAYNEGDYDEARGKWQEALAVFEELGNKKEKAGALHQLGVLAQAQGDYVTARDFYQQSLEIDQALGNRAGMASSIAQLGRLADSEENYVTAVRLWTEALQTFEALGSPNKEIVAGWFTRLREKLGEEAFQRLLEEAQGDNDERL